MAGATDVVVRFLADVSQISDGVKKIEGTTANLGKWAKRAGALIGGAFAVDQIKDWVNAAQEAEAANRKLEQTLKNAGDSTGQWAKHAEDLANTLQYKTGIDDEVIKGGQAILGTFHDLAGAAGQQSGAFDRATKAALDMSKTGFGDVNSAATMLGKALQDPIKGVTALRRVGIQLTDAEQEQIKAFVAAGDKAGAMNVILGEVENQVGGVAESSATSADKMKVAWGETQEALGNALLPVLERLAPAVAALAMFVQQNATWLVPFAAAIAGLVIALKAWIGAQTLLNGLLAGFGIELGVSTGLVLLIAVAVAALIAAVVVLYAKWDQVWAAIGNMPWYAKVGLAVLALASGVGEMIVVTAAFGVFWSNIWARVTQVADFARRLITAQLSAIASTLTTFVNVAATILGFMARIVDAFLVQPFQRAWEFINRVVGWILDRISQLAGPLKTLGDAVSKIGDIAGSIGGAIGSISPFANGGIVTRPTLALIGEAGPEAVVPLSRGTTGVGGGNVTININAGGLGADAPAIQSAVVAALRSYTIRNGPLPATVTGV